MNHSTPLASEEVCLQEAASTMGLTVPLVYLILAETPLYRFWVGVYLSEDSRLGPRTIAFRKSDNQQIEISEVRITFSLSESSTIEYAAFEDDGLARRTEELLREKVIYSGIPFPKKSPNRSSRLGALEQPPAYSPRKFVQKFASSIINDGLGV
jgi:hypothetical protein